MPYEIHVARGSSVSDRTDDPISRDEWLEVLERGGMMYEDAPTGEDALWFRYDAGRREGTPEGELWFRGACVSGIVQLSTSYSNPRIRRNSADLANHGTWIATELGARAYEPAAIQPSEARLTIHKPGVQENLHWKGDLVLSVDGTATDLQMEDRLLTADMLRDLWAVGSSWLTDKDRAFQAAFDQMTKKGAAAVEVPIGTLDCFVDVALFRAWPARPVSRTMLEAELRAMGIDVLFDEPVLFFKAADEWAGQALLREDGHWQLKIAHARCPWRAAAPATLEVARDPTTGRRDDRGHQRPLRRRDGAPVRRAHPRELRRVPRLGPRARRALQPRARAIDGQLECVGARARLDGARTWAPTAS